MKGSAGTVKPEQLSRLLYEQEERERSRVPHLLTMHVTQPCRFLTCLEPGEHLHNVCPDCGAVRYGNLHCLVCQEFHRAINTLIAEAS